MSLAILQNFWNSPIGIDFHVYRLCWTTWYGNDLQIIPVLEESMTVEQFLRGEASRMEMRLAVSLHTNQTNFYICDLIHFVDVVVEELRPLHVLQSDYHEDLIILKSLKWSKEIWKSSRIGYFIKLSIYHVFLFRQSSWSLLASPFLLSLWWRKNSESPHMMSYHSQIGIFWCCCNCHTCFYFQALHLERLTKTMWSIECGKSRSESMPSLEKWLMFTRRHEAKSCWHNVGKIGAEGKSTSGWLGDFKIPITQCRH